MKNLLFRYVVVLFCSMAILDASAQEGMIKGRILTSDGKPVSAVSIRLKEIRRGTVSTEDGIYQLSKLPAGRYTIIVSFVGVKTQEQVVELSADQSIVADFSLEENNSQLAEVIVTYGKGMNEKPVSAGKVSIKPMDLPQSVAVIGKDMLERQQVLQLSDVLQNVTGVYLMGTTGGYQEEIAGRGFSFGSNNTFKNGSRFNNGAMPEMSGVEKVEFLKGGNAILFGNVAAGGILNIVTKKPKFEKGGEISFRTGSYDFYKPSIDLYGAFDKNKTAAYRINTTFQKNRSYRDDVKAERFYINPSFLLNLGSKTQFLLEGDFLKDNRTPDFGTGAINYTIANVPRSRYLGVSWGYNRAEQKTATATLTHELKKNWQLRGQASYQAYEVELFGAARPVGIREDGTWARGLQRSRTEEDYYLAQLDLTGKFKTGKISHTVLFGADMDQYKTRSFAFVNNRYNANGSDASIRNLNVYDTINLFDPASFGRRSDIPFLATDRITTSPIIRSGIYLQDLICVSEKVKLLAGVRYSYQHNRRATVDSIAKSSTGYVAGYSNDAFSPRLSIVYQPIKQVSVFASYTNSFNVNTGVDVNNENLAPSIVDQFELGAKTDILNGLVSMNLTLYQIVNDNFAQTALFLADGATPNTNNNIRELAGEVTSKGVELDVATKPVHGFSFMAGYSYNETKYTGGNGRNFITGDRLRYNPAHTANAGIFYSFSEASALRGFNAGMNVYYVGSRLAGRNPSGLNPNYKLMALPDYTLFDLSAGYSVHNFSLRLKMTNLLNKLSYNVHDDNSVNPIAPRQFAATIAYKL